MMLSVVEKSLALEEKLAHAAAERKQLRRRLGETLRDLRRLRASYKRQSAEMQSELDLLSQVHRRPRGLAIIKSFSRLRGSARRIVVGLPVLLYLLAISGVGELLHRLWLRTRQG